MESAKPNFSEWFVDTAWLEYPAYLLPDVAFEVECKRLDPNFEGFFIDSYEEYDNGDLIVSKDRRWDD